MESYIKQSHSNKSDTVIAYCFQSISPHKRHINVMTSQITGNSSVYSTTCSDYYRRIYESSALLALYEGNLLVNDGYRQRSNNRFHVTSTSCTMTETPFTSNTLTEEDTTSWICKMPEFQCHSTCDNMGLTLRITPCSLAINLIYWSFLSPALFTYSGLVTPPGDTEPAQHWL